MTILVSQKPLAVTRGIFYSLFTINLHFQKEAIPAPAQKGLLGLLAPGHQLLFTLTAEGSLGLARLKYRRRRDQS